MKLAIIDDETHWRENIEKQVRTYFFNLTDEELEIDIYKNGTEYLENKVCYDISLVDIEMPGLDGFQIIKSAKEYNTEGIFIILTTHTELSRKGYVVNAFRYVDKLRMEEELQEAFDSAKQILAKNEKITVNVVGEGSRELLLKNIIHMESMFHCITIYTKHGESRCSNTLKDVSKMIPEGWFYRCHNSYIVNLDEIKYIEDRIVYMSNGMKAEISNRRFAEFKQVYLKRKYEQANR